MGEGLPGQYWAAGSTIPPSLTDPGAAFATRVGQLSEVAYVCAPQSQSLPVFLVEILSLLVAWSCQNHVPFPGRDNPSLVANAAQERTLDSTGQHRAEEEQSGHWKAHQVT